MNEEMNDDFQWNEELEIGSNGGILEEDWFIARNLW